MAAEGWTYNPSFSTVGSGDQAFVGYFGKGGSAIKTFETLPTHASIYIVLTLSRKGSWDNEIFMVIAD